MFKFFSAVICIIGLVALFMFTTNKLPTQVQDKLGEQVQNVMNETGISNDVKLSMMGRDVNLTGTFPSDEKQNQVVSEIKEIFGVRHININDQNTNVAINNNDQDINKSMDMGIDTNNDIQTLAETNKEMLVDDLKIEPLVYEYTFMLKYGAGTRTSVKAMTDTTEMVNRITKRAKSRFGFDNLDLDVKSVKGTIPENWNNLLMQAIFPTAKSFTSVTYIVNNNNIFIDGVVASTKDKMRQEKVIKTLIPENFNAQLNITVE